MIKLSKSERNKLEKFIRAKHGNLKKISDEIKLSDNTIKSAYKGVEVSMATYNLIKAKLETLN